MRYSVVIQHMRSFTIYLHKKGTGRYLEDVCIGGRSSKYKDRITVDFMYREFHGQISYYLKDCKYYLALKSHLNIALNVKECAQINSILKYSLTYGCSCKLQPNVRHSIMGVMEWCTRTLSATNRIILHFVAFVSSAQDSGVS